MNQTPSATALPVRDVVRVVIIRDDDKVCLCKKPAEGSALVWITLPGGGVEPGDTHVETVIKECMEEVGMLVRGVTPLNLVTLSPGEVNRTERKGKFSAISTTYYLAVFKKMDASLLGHDEDAMQYEWVSISDAIKAVQKGPYSVFTEGRVQALRAAQALVCGFTKGSNDYAA